jgi:hypothetical protein
MCAMPLEIAYNQNALVSMLGKKFSFNPESMSMAFVAMVYATIIGGNVKSILIVKLDANF